MVNSVSFVSLSYKRLALVQKIISSGFHQSMVLILSRLGQSTGFHLLWSLQKTYVFLRISGRMDINRFEWVWLLLGAKFGDNPFCLLIVFIVFYILLNWSSCCLKHTYSKHYTIGIVPKIFFHRWTYLSELIDFSP